MDEKHRSAENNTLRTENLITLNHDFKAMKNFYGLTDLGSNPSFTHYQMCEPGQFITIVGSQFLNYKIKVIPIYPPFGLL